MSTSLAVPTTSLRRTTVMAGAAAAVATTAGAAILRAAGMHLAASGEIPLVAFAQCTFVGAIVGGLLVAVLNRRSAAPSRRFLQAVVALTALSCVPAIAGGDGVASKVGLVATHLLAAAIIVPLLARQATA